MACYVYRKPDQPNLIYKIGKANIPTRRFETLQPAYCTDISEFYFIRPVAPNYTSDDLFTIEHAAHCYFRQIRVTPNREFFNFDDRDLMAELENFMKIFSQRVFPVRLFRSEADLQLIEAPEEEPDHKMNVIREKNAADIKAIFDNLDKLSEEFSNLSLNKTTTQEPISPYPYQLEILNKMSAWYQGNASAGKLILPPGIGKSYITGFFIRDQKIKKVLVLVPLKVIADDFTAALKNCGIKTVSTVSCETKGKFSDDSQVYVAVINTARSLTSNPEPDADIETESFRALTFDLVVYDEAHHMCAEGNKKLMETIPSKKKLYLTATEKIMENKNETKNADQDKVFHMNSPEFGDIIYKMTIPEAIGSGRLTDYKLFLARHDQLIYNAKTDNSTGIANLIEELKTKYQRRKIIIFANSIQNAEKINAKLTEKNYSAECISEKTSRPNRLKIVKKFEDDQFGIICNVATIGEGANIPCIDTVVFAEPRHSNIGVIQNVGRGLRLFPNPKKEYCMVIIHSNMITKDFLENLAINDERIENEPKKMLIPTEQKSIQTEVEVKFLKLIEQIRKNKTRTMEDFIREVRRQNVFDEKTYGEKLRNLPDFPAWPMIPFEKFKWEMLNPNYKEKTEEQKTKNKNESEQTEIYQSEMEIYESIHRLHGDVSICKLLSEAKNTEEKIKILKTYDKRIPNFNLLKEMHIIGKLKL